MDCDNAYYLDVAFAKHTLCQKLEAYNLIGPRPILARDLHSLAPGHRQGKSEVTNPQAGLIAEHVALALLFALVRPETNVSCL